jgi:hypothetical protein
MKTRNGGEPQLKDSKLITSSWKHSSVTGFLLLLLLLLAGCLLTRTVVTQNQEFASIIQSDHFQKPVQNNVAISGRFCGYENILC